MCRLRVLHDHDRNAFLQRCPEPGEVPGLPYVRDLIPPPHYVVDVLAEWACKWLQCGVDSNGTLLFTVSTLVAVQRLLDAAVLWRLSGEGLALTALQACLPASQPTCQPASQPANHLCQDHLAAAVAAHMK